VKAAAAAAADKNNLIKNEACHISGRLFLQLFLKESVKEMKKMLLENK
jgi:hypothetical protein